METPICSECQYMFSCGGEHCSLVYYKKNNKCKTFKPEHFLDNPFTNYAKVIEKKNYIKWKVERGL